ncbi:hypothetical protein G6F56_002275 [Rhizopus delemar]|nr:hypothetical protein G6F56_002275 [Rhizopus delemar]
MTISSQVSEQILKTKNEQDIALILKDQKDCLEVYRDSEKKLEAFNKFSKVRYQDVYQQFEQHAKLLKQVKKDMNSVFIKLQKMKSQLNEKYPEQYEAAVNKHPPLVIEEEEEE